MSWDDSQGRGQCQFDTQLHGWLKLAQRNEPSSHRAIYVVNALFHIGLQLRVGPVGKLSKSVSLLLFRLWAN